MMEDTVGVRVGKGRGRSNLWWHRDRGT